MEEDKKDFKIIPWKDYRFIVINPSTGEILDDAQGYGFTSKEKALKCWLYKINKNDINKDFKNVLKIYKANKELFDKYKWIFEDHHVIMDGDDPKKLFFETIKKENEELYNSLTKTYQNRLVDILTYGKLYKNFKKHK